MGQEAVISVSFPVDNILEFDNYIVSYSSDGSLLSKLASLAICSGFDFVKINQVNGTLSVAVKECTNENAR